MRFVDGGPDVPQELILAQEKGAVIFVCGAGVSHGAGLPLFRGLVEKIYENLGESWDLHAAEREGMDRQGVLANQYDRVLRSLERRLVASEPPRNRRMRERIRHAVHQALLPPDNANLRDHLALLELSRDSEGRNRILTTNFDTLFERAWFEKHGEPIASHAGAAMPQPKGAGCTGVLHLHGRLADPRVELRATVTDLVLTSAEFGDAYLRTGWASRYIYDVVRAYTVVLVGYQADDPPMRYLLEALEADRERYPDLQKVYAFASCRTGDDEREHALWVAKGVIPVLYVANEKDHSTLYSTLREWRDYAEDPTGWRREQLRPILSEAPSKIEEEHVRRCVELLGHGDASQLLGELCPASEWLSILVERRVFDRGRPFPGQWVAKSINDPTMIRACGGLRSLDESMRWHITRALEQQHEVLSPLRKKAWRLLLAARRHESMDRLGDGWFTAMPAIKRGEVDFETRRLICRIVQPRLEISKAFHWRDDQDDKEPEALHQFFRIELETPEYPRAEDILEIWPQDLDKVYGLFRALDRAMLDALDEAEALGLLDGWDRVGFDVPSVAPHGQNAYKTGFYPITRLLADLWQRIAARDTSLARDLVQPWASSRFLLRKRLSLFAHTHTTFSPDDVTAAIARLEDSDFWGNSRVELMRLLVGRWIEFKLSDRLAIEARIRQGEPRHLYPENAFENDEEWRSVHDSSIYRRLKRIQLAGRSLSTESLDLIAEISARHPKWEPSSKDRDDFQFWSETRRGPDGQPELLTNIADDMLVKEAMRLQREHRLEQNDIWRVFCSADPERALRGLGSDADKQQWSPEAWRCLLWAANEKGDASFQLALADLLLRIPDAPLLELLPPAVSWLQGRRGLLSASDNPGGPRFLPLWDRFAALAYKSDREQTDVIGDDDLLTEALNRPGGLLAASLLDSLSEQKPQRNSGLCAVFKPRFEQLVTAPGRAGLMARVYLARALDYLDAIDPMWTETHFHPRFSWSHPEALPLWRSFANCPVGSARLFNALKPAMLAAFERQELSDNELQGLASNLLSVAIWHQRGKAPEYDLTTANVRRALTVGPPSARRNVSWNLWRMMSKAGNDPEKIGEDIRTGKPAYWRAVVGPLFQNIWPLDAALRSEEASRHLVMMALECGEAFPEAVDAIIDVIVPYQLYQIGHSLRLDQRHNQLVREYPLAFLRLANALIDPNVFPVPNDLGNLLDECIAVDPSVARHPEYVRLHALRRLSNA